MGSLVTVLPFGETLEVRPGESVLKAILRQGRFVKYGCKHGGCSTCRAEVVQGDYELSDNTSFSLSDADRAAGVVLLCSTFIQTDELVVDVSRTMDDLGEDQYLAGQHVQEYLATVDRVEALTHDIRWLGLRLKDPATFAFTAGQYVEVAVPGTADSWRSFSMANPPGEAGRGRPDRQGDTRRHLLGRPGQRHRGRRSAAASWTIWPVRRSPVAPADDHGGRRFGNGPHLRHAQGPRRHAKPP